MHVKQKVLSFLIGFIVFSFTSLSYASPYGSGLYNEDVYNGSNPPSSPGNDILPPNLPLTGSQILLLSLAVILCGLLFFMILTRKRKKTKNF